MTNADTQIKDRLKAVRDDIRQARATRGDLRKERDAAKAAFADVKDDGATKITEMAEFKNAEMAVRKLGEVDDQLADLQVAEHGLLTMLGEQFGTDPAGVNPTTPASLARWDGHALLASSEEYTEARKHNLFSSRQRFGTIEMGSIVNRDNFASFLSPRQAAFLPAASPGPVAAPTAAGAVPPDIRGIIPPYLKTLSLLDIIPSGTTDSNLVQYVQVTAIPGNAAETDQLALKPQEGLATQDATAPVRTIAGYIKAARQQLDDVAGLATMINTLLPYDVRRRIEYQMLLGDGTGVNLLGIMHTAGISEPVAVAGDNVADAILRAMTTIVLSDAEPNFCTMNPLAVQDLRLLRAEAADGSWQGQYLYGSPSEMIPPTVWGLAITSNRLIPQGSPLVGDAMGAALLVREAVNVKTSDADQDDFVRNRVTILAEARVAFPVWKPVAFAVAAQG